MSESAHAFDVVVIGSGGAGVRGLRMPNARAVTEERYRVRFSTS